MAEECRHYKCVVDPVKDTLYERCDLPDGDQHAFHHYVPMCRERNEPRYSCTRILGHLGPHIAANGADGGGVLNDLALATWGLNVPAFNTPEEADEWLEAQNV